MPSMKIMSDRLILVTFAGSWLLLAILGGISIRLSRSFFSGVEQIAELNDVSNHLDLLRESVRDTEIAGEGYARTRQELFLNLFQNATRRVETEIRVLRGVQDTKFWEPTRFQVLIEKILDRQRRWHKRVEAVKQGGSPEDAKIEHPLDTPRLQQAHDDDLRSFHWEVQSQLRNLRGAAYAESGYLGWTSVAVVLAGLTSTAVCWWLIRNDVSRSRLTQRKLQESQARFAGILEISEDAIITVDDQHRIVFFNQGAERMFGFQGEEILGQSLDLLIPERFRPRHLEKMHEFAQHGPRARRMGERSEVFGQRKGGHEFPAEASISTLVVNEQRLFTAVLRDITERRRIEQAKERLNEELEKRVHERTAELEAAMHTLREKNEEVRSTTQQLWQAAKLASVGELAASIAHELNNPLATVSLRVEGILDRTPPEDSRRRALEIVEQELDRMSRLVGNLLQFSRQGTEQFSTVDLRNELVSTLELTHHHLRKRQIRVDSRIDPELPRIFADKQKLRQVFLNLITNACDAMLNGGVLTLRGTSGTLREQHAIVIDISDTGVGIPTDLLGKVMDPFFTTKEEGKGTGLGLAICRRIVHEHSGTIDIFSETGKGTTVRVVLPLTRPNNVHELHRE